jgi:hypothetical protein
MTTAIFKLTSKIINEWDPYGLLALGAPDDEYEAEIKEIINAWADVSTPEELAKEINRVMNWYFGKLYYNKEQSLTVAKKLFAALNDLKATARESGA